MEKYDRQFKEAVQWLPDSLAKRIHDIVQEVLWDGGSYINNTSATMMGILQDVVDREIESEASSSGEGYPYEVYEAFGLIFNEISKECKSLSKELSKDAKVMKRKYGTDERPEGGFDPI